MLWDDNAEALRARNLRVTPQRRAILGAFTGSADEHLSAVEVHARAVRAVPEIGRGTVYAALAELTELGLLAASGTSEPVRYEANVQAHQHFRCRTCGRVFDVAFPDPDLAGLRHDGFRVERVAMTAEGICSSCESYVRGLRSGARRVRGQRLLGDEAIAATACATHDSPVGTLALAASPDGLVRVAFDDHADWEPLAECASARRGPRSGRRRLVDARAALERYFDGEHVVYAGALDAHAPTSQPGPIVDTRTIPHGAFRSYERVAPTISAFDCGYAMGSNPVPLLFPCHRVSRGAQRPHAYVGGPQRLRVLLALEAR